ncbi:hypothetical protein BC938DRAFT_481016 [Jimgerdemannia flammicorona]|uniref:Uncharacterized protein n=1 Tax=Jimgerdemannia flammicorona TaxID=994334 RepID=A0A433QXB6_9FUNG|nr:hypothetical protein BC938DRAFT_481016 [Jimgerdemannia flammicorona]
MTHLSDFSFLQRAVSLTYLYIFLIIRVYQVNHFQCLAPSRLRAGELKGIVTVLVMIAIPFQLYYGRWLPDLADCNWTSTKIKYDEGFMMLPNTATIVNKPFEAWTDADKALVPPTDYSLCVGFSLQTYVSEIHFAHEICSFWNYLANSVAKASFMGSLEFKWCGVSIIMFPALQYNFSRSVYDPTWKEIIPELAYGVGFLAYFAELLIVCMLGIQSHFRFTKLISQTRNSTNEKTIVQKLTYFMEMNKILIVALLVDSVSLITLSVDGLTPEAFLNKHKFTADLFICNANFASFIIWFLVIMIFHPRHGYGGVGTTSSFNTTNGQARTHVVDGTHSVVPIHDQPNTKANGYIPYGANDATGDLKDPPPPLSPTTPKYQNYNTNPPPKSPKSPQRPTSPAHNGSSSSEGANASGETRPLATDHGIEFYAVTSDRPPRRRPSSPAAAVPRPRADDIPMQTMFEEECGDRPSSRQQHRVPHQRPGQGSFDNGGARRDRNLQRDNSTDSG